MPQKRLTDTSFVSLSMKNGEVQIPSKIYITFVRLGSMKAEIEANKSIREKQTMSIDDEIKSFTFVNVSIINPQRLRTTRRAVVQVGISG